MMDMHKINLFPHEYSRYLIDSEELFWQCWSHGKTFGSC